MQARKILKHKKEQKDTTNKKFLLIEEMDKFE